MNGCCAYHATERRYQQQESYVRATIPPRAVKIHTAWYNDISVGDKITCRREINVINVVKNTTCFAEHEKAAISCEKSGCRQWMNSSCHFNCALIAAKRNEAGLTLQEVGEIFDVTRMRICQIEKNCNQ